MLQSSSEDALLVDNKRDRSRAEHVSKDGQRANMQFASLFFVVACFILFAAVFVAPAVQADDETTENPGAKAMKDLLAKIKAAKKPA